MFDQMLTILVVIFVIAYAAIALEHPLKINKSASALIGAGLLWTVYAVMTGDHHLVGDQLNESLASTAQIVFFLMGAMTIVEVVDAHNGFEVITSRIKTTKLSSLMWLVGFVTFFLSAVLDNLTTTIVMISLMKKLLDKHDDRLFFAGIIVIAANAGGAWSPIGDVTTTMLWIGGQITTLAIMKGCSWPSLVNLIVPLAVTSYLLKGREVVAPARVEENGLLQTTPFERNLMFFMGIGILVCVPVFKTVTHLPPFMGILFGLGILWLVGELIHRKKEDEDKEHLTLVHALKRIDMSSHRLLHRHPAGRGHPGAHPYPERRWPSGWTRPSAARTSSSPSSAWSAPSSTTCRWWPPPWGCTAWPSTRPTASCGSSWPTAPAPAARS